MRLQHVLLSAHAIYVPIILGQQYNMGSPSTSGVLTTANDISFCYTFARRADVALRVFAILIEFTFRSFKMIWVIHLSMRALLR